MRGLLSPTGREDERGLVMQERHHGCRPITEARWSVAIGINGDDPVCGKATQETAEEGGV
jgi:hypothetical protein